MNKKIVFQLAVVFLFIFSLSGCQYLKKRVEKKEKTEFTLSSSGKQRIEIENTNGNVDVITTNDTLGNIYISAEKIGRVRINETDKPIEGVDIIIDSTGDVITIRTESLKSFSLFGNKRNAKVNYVVKIPVSLNVKVNLVNGTISADGIKSSSRLESVNGPIYINHCTGNINAETVNGSIKANVDSIRSFVAETVNGTITVGSLKGVNAQVEASCVNGRVKTENLNFTTMTSERKNLSGKLGNGSGLIKLSTVNGSIKLNGDYVSYKKKDDKNWEFKFEFDDNDEPVKIEVKQTDEQKGIEINPVDTVKKADSVKSK